ncbi:MAG TPA: hypothetical protein VHU90_12400 [Galbitalea sp.]|nr:hypothetical protein [Galbitalea sp.]
MLKKTLFAAAIAAVLAVGGSLGFATPAFADPTPAPDPTTTISNLAVTLVQDASGRQAFIQFNYTIDDPTADSDSIAEVTTFDTCDTPTVVDVDNPLPSALGGGISFYVTVPADGYVEVKIYSSNGAAAPLVSAPVDATDVAVTSSDTTASFTPSAPATSGSLVILVGGRVPQSTFQLYSNGAPTGPVITVPGCGEDVQSYSAAPGTVLTLHNIDGDFDAATTTIPGAVSGPADPGVASLPTTGVGPGSWYAGGFGLVAVFVGAVLLLVEWRVRRRRQVTLR